MFILLWKNVSATKNRRVQMPFFILYKNKEDVPDDLLQARDHYKNLFELPLLFYLLCILVYLTVDVTIVDLVFSWSFVAFRYIHSYIRATSNWVPRRFAFFAAGFVVLFVHWVFFAIRISGLINV
jgi:hypothetical protein